MTPTVSVVVGTYNHARFLPRALQSVFAQGWPEEALEVIVVDDGSTDATPKLMPKWERRGVRYIRKENGGNLSTFNRGIAEATGEYIALLDGDDMWRPRKLAPRIEPLERDPGIGLVHGDLCIVDARGKVLVPSLFAARGFQKLDGELLGELLWRNVVSSGTLVFRASLREHCHPIPAWGRAQDWWIAAKIAEVARIGCVREPVIDYRRHGGNLNLGAGRDQAMRLARKELPLRRHLLTGLDTGRLPVPAILRGLDALDAITLGLMARGDERAALTPVEPAQRAAAGERRTSALAALADGGEADAAHHLVAALAHDPWDTEARCELSALRRRRGWLGDARPRRHALRPLPAERPHGARGFVVAADGGELVRDSRLLAGYAQHFGAGDDVTLAISVAEDALGDLAAAVSAAGLDGADAPDLLAITHGVTPAADAVLSARPPQAALHRPIPWADADGLAGLSAWRRRKSGQPAPLSFALAIAARDWSEAAECPDAGPARRLQRRLHRLGHPCAVLTRADWDSAHDAAFDVVVHLRRATVLAPHPGQTNLLWALDGEPPLLECDRSDVVLAASGAVEAALRGRTTAAVALLDPASAPAEQAASLVAQAERAQGAFAAGRREPVAAGAR